MKMIKRMAAAVLAAVMAMVVLTACSSISPTQEKVRNELNEARAQNGVAALEWSEEANAHARDFANEYQKLLSSALSGSSHFDSELDRAAWDLVMTTADGKSYKTMCYLDNPDFSTVSDLLGKSVAQDGSATVVGMALAVVGDTKTMIILVY
ncbi:MAG: CAP domain-containing protein [Faecalibacterium prausnitzii]|nr:CAP domain-containing protein [Faecalibacterium prausnitzii]